MFLIYETQIYIPITENVFRVVQFYKVFAVLSIKCIQKHNTCVKSLYYNCKIIGFRKWMCRDSFVVMKKTISVNITKGVTDGDMI